LQQSPGDASSTWHDAVAFLRKFYDDLAGGEIDLGHAFSAARRMLKNKEM
jgi:sugar phosphate isomerase/epimerase